MLNRSEYIPTGPVKNKQFETKRSFRMSCVLRADGELFWYIWGNAALDWEYAAPSIKKDFSELVLERCNENSENAAKVRAPQGSHKYPGIHIRPRGYSVKPFKLTEVKSIIDGKHEITLIIPNSLRRKFS